MECTVPYVSTDRNIRYYGTGTIQRKTNRNEIKSEYNSIFCMLPHRAVPYGNIDSDGMVLYGSTVVDPLDSIISSSIKINFTVPVIWDQ